MASIGGVTCDFLHGNVGDLKESVRTWRVPGRDGYGAIKLGKGSSGFSFRAVRYGASGTVETWIGSINDLQGTIVSATDDWSVTHNNLLVLVVGEPDRQPDVGNGGARGEIAISGVVLS